MGDRALDERVLFLALGVIDDPATDLSCAAVADPVRVMEIGDRYDLDRLAGFTLEVQHDRLAHQGGDLVDIDAGGGESSGVGLAEPLFDDALERVVHPRDLQAVDSANLQLTAGDQRAGRAEATGRLTEE